MSLKKRHWETVPQRGVNSEQRWCQSADFAGARIFWTFSDLRGNSQMKELDFSRPDWLIECQRAVPRAIKHKQCGFFRTADCILPFSGNGSRRIQR